MNQLILKESELVELIISSIDSVKKKIHEQTGYPYAEAGGRKIKDDVIVWPNGAKEPKSTYEKRLKEWRDSDEFNSAEYAGQCNWKLARNFRGIHQYLYNTNRLNFSEFTSMDWRYHEDVWDDENMEPKGTPRDHSPHSIACEYLFSFGNVIPFDIYTGCMIGCDDTPFNRNKNGWLCIDATLQKYGFQQSGMANEWNNLGDSKQSPSLAADMIFLIQTACIDRKVHETLPSPPPPPPPPPKKNEASDLGELSYNSKRKKWEYVDSDGSVIDAEVVSKSDGARASGYMKDFMKFTDNLFGDMGSFGDWDTRKFMEDNPKLFQFLIFIIELGEPVWNALSNGLKWINDYCTENGWHCIEIIASVAALVLFVGTLFVGTTLALEVGIVFLGAVTVVAMWEQGKRGWAIAVGVLEMFGIFRLFKLLKMRGFFSFLGGPGAVLSKPEILESAIKYFEEPTQALYSKLGPEVRAAVDYIKKFSRDASEALKNSGKVDEAIEIMDKIKNWKQFQVFSKTKEWLKLKELKNIKTWDDFVKYKKFSKDLADYTYKIQKGINMAVTTFKWVLGLGLVGLGAYFTWRRMEQIFTEQQLEALDKIAKERLGAEATYADAWDTEEDRECLMDIYIDRLNEGCNPEWNTFLESAAGRHVEEDTNEAKWEWLVNDMMYRKNTTDTRDIMEDIFSELKQYMDGSVNCFEGDKVSKDLAECSQVASSERKKTAFNARKVAKALMETMKGFGKTDETEFWTITYSLSKQQKLEVRKSFATMGECLCDWIEGDFDFGEKEALEAWDMYEEGIINNCTCYDDL